MLAGKKVVVTGGAGFVGSHVVDLLVRAGCQEIVVLDSLVHGRASNLAYSGGRNGRDRRVRLVEADIRDSVLVAHLIEGAHTVFHHAAPRVARCAARRPETLAVMARATSDLFNACVRHNVRKVVFASATDGTARHGAAEGHPTHADHALYRAAKTAGERLLGQLHDAHGLDYVALRCPEVYGRRMDLHGRHTSELIRWIEQIDAGEPPTFGGGASGMNLVHVTDVAEANLLAATSDVTDTVLTVESGTDTLDGVARALAAAMGRPDLAPAHAPEWAVAPLQPRLDDAKGSHWPLTRRTRTSLAHGLQDLVGWWRSEQPCRSQRMTG